MSVVGNIKGFCLIFYVIGYYVGYFMIDRGIFFDCVYYCFISFIRQIFLYFFMVEYVVVVIIS